MPGPPYTTGLVLSLDAALGVWKDTGKTTAATLSGDQVALWADQSGNANDVQQATAANRPLLELAQINSLPTLRFDPAGTFSNLQNAAFAGSSQSQTIFMVFKTTSRAVQGTLIGQNAVASYWSTTVVYSSFDGTTARATPLGAVGPFRDFQVLTIIYDVTGCTFRVNGAPTGFSGATAAMALVAMTNLFIGTNNTNVQPLVGDIAELLIYNTPLAGGNLTSVESYLLAKYALPLTFSTAHPLRVDEGDSITAGVATTLNTQEFPDVAYRSASNQVPAYNYINYAVSGSQYTDLTNRAAVIDALYNAARGANGNILHVFCGTNDIKLGGQTGTQAYARLQTYCLARKAVGWKTVVYTMLPREAVAQTETDRGIFNGLIRGNAGGAADVICDVGADSILGIAGAQNNTVYYNADKIHPNATGQGILSAYATAADVKALATNSTIVIGGSSKGLLYAGGLPGF